MANVFLGSVYATLELRDEGISQAARRTREAFSGVEKEANKVTFGSFTRNAATSLDSVADSIGRVLKGAVAVGVTGAAGMGAMTKAAFDQVRQVQNASFGLRAYEKDASKVNQILGELVEYAKSDMGVLFQRQDLFKAASNLRGFGIEADKVTGYVKILSKGVSLGMTNFDELSQILGRVAASGKLSAAEFDMLAQRGIILDASMRGADVTAEQLFETLNNALPDSLLEGRANTIDGAMTRLQSAFRNLGASILGVNADADGFVKGGAGDILMTAMEDLRQMLRDPIFVEAFKQMGEEIANFAAEAIPPLMEFVKVVAENFDTVIALIKGLAVAFVALKVASTGLTILSTISGLISTTSKAIGGIGKGAAIAKGGFDTFLLGLQGIGGAIGIASRAINGLGLGVRMVGLAFKGLFGFLLTNPIGWVIIAIVALVAGFVLLWKNVEGFRNFFIGAWDGIKNAAASVSDWFTGTFVPALASAWESIKTGAAGIGDFFSGVWQGIKDGVAGVGDFFVSAWGGITEGVSTAFDGVVGVVNEVFNAINSAYEATLKPVVDGIIYVLTALATVVGTIFSGIAEVIYTVVSTIVQIIGVILYGSFLWLWNNVLIPTGEFFVNVFNAIVQTVATAVAAVWSTITTVFNAVVGFLTPILSTIWTAIKTAFDTVVTAISSALNAAWGVITRIWNAIVAFLSPVLEAIKSVVSSVWNSIKTVVGNVMEGIRNTVTNIWNGIKGAIDGIINGIKGAVSAGFAFIRDNIIQPIQDAYNRVKQFASDFVSAGKSIIDGIVRGVSNGKDAVVSKIKDICAGALDAVKDFFGIKSPSRVMAKMFGYVTQGAEVGLEKNAGSFMRTFNDVFNNLPSVDLTPAFSDSNIRAAYAKGMSVDYGGAMDKTTTNIYGDIRVDNQNDQFGVIDMLNRGAVLAKKGMTTDA